MTKEREHSSNLLHSFACIFYLCKFLGIYPQDFRTFRQKTVLHNSTLGSVFVVVMMFLIFINYNIMVYYFEDVAFKTKRNNLELVVNLVLTYIGPFVLLTDQMTALLNQQELGELFERIRSVDEELLQHNVIVDNRKITVRIRLMIALAVVLEFIVNGWVYVMLVDRIDWKVLIWMFTCVPTFYDTLDKVWFVSLLMGLKQRFEAINTSFEQVAERHDRLTNLKANKKYRRACDKEDFSKMSSIITVKLGSSKNKRVEPIDVLQSCFGESLESQQKLQSSELNLVYDSDLTNVEVIEQKFISLCQLHDDICGIAKTLNEMWCYPLLVLMAFGFVTVVAQLYFIYSATQNQADIPSLFGQAQQLFVAMLYLVYVAGKCVSIMFLSWRTSLESKRAGICLHKCAVAADNNAIYEIVNHLSLKFLNHAVNFSACGFFDLNMENLYAICGGITTYLIILIQFNMANLQAKNAKTLANITKTEELSWNSGNATNYINYSFYLSGLNY